MQNHKDSAITTLEDYQKVLAVINAPRVKAILKVGHFQNVGIHWKKGWDLLGDRIALIYVNDIHDGQSVLYGTGEVDMHGLRKQIKQTHFDGNIMVELKLATHDTQPQLTLDGLRHTSKLLFDFYDAC